MKTTTDIRERIAVRAYYMWLRHYQRGVVNAVLPGNDVGYWLAAESVEMMLDEEETQRAERRSAAARKAAKTRKAKAAAKVPAGAIAAARKAVSRRASPATAH